MSVSSIQCPNCKSQISVDQVLTHQIEESLKQKFQAESEAEKIKYRKEMQEWKEEKEKTLAGDLTEKIKQEILATSQEESKRLQEKLEEKEKIIAESRQKELTFLKKEEELEQKSREMELTVQRQISEERGKIWEKAQVEFSEKHLLKEREQSQIIESLKRSLEDAQRKAAQGSQQLQGEVQELELEQLLKAEFPTDEILSVAKGINGADAIQKIHDSAGRNCGTIVWESKRTKNWSDGWISKLKEDLQLAKGDIAVLVTATLPENIKNFGYKEGIYVTNFDCLLSVAKVLRMVIIKEQSIKQSVVGKNEKMEVLYNYLSGNEFRQRIEAIVEAFSSMQMDLDQEKRAFQKLWAKREKEIERVINNTVGLHGELQGLMGTSLQSVKGLELDNFDLIATTEVIVSSDSQTIIQTSLIDEEKLGI